MKRIDINALQRLRDFNPDNNSDYDHIGKMKGMDVYLCDDFYYGIYSKKFVLASSQKIVAEVDLSKVKHNIWTIDWVAVDDLYKGNNIAPLFYRYILRKCKITLKAGSTQSPGGRYIWNELAKYKDVLVFAYKNRTAHVLDPGEEGELTSDDLDPYAYESLGVYAMIA